MVAALDRAKAGEGGVIGLVAEPGVGKSRLCHEFAQRCREDEVEVFEAQAQAHGTSIPFMPVLQMLRAFFGIGERETEQLAREKIAGRALLLDPGFAEDLPLMFDFLGVPDPDRPVPQMSPEARQRALGGIVCRLVNAPSRRKTLVLMIEDLHWIDEGSNAMLADLVASIEGTNTLAVVNFRPEYSPPWQGSPSYREISLEPLARGRHPRAAARPGRRGPLARRSRRADPRAHPGQSVLHRGDRPRAGRGGSPRGRARRLPPGPADRGRRRPGHGAGDPRGADRPARPGRQAAAAGRLGGRQGGQRPGPGADRRARAPRRSTPRSAS